jgi:hypothetical protein
MVKIPENQSKYYMDIIEKFLTETPEEKNFRRFMNSRNKK